MKKLLLTLVAIFAVANVAAKCGSCKVETIKAQKPECFQLVEKPVCAERHVIPAEEYFTCPANSQQR